jgi:hypothetical protein
MALLVFTDKAQRKKPNLLFLTNALTNQQTEKSKFENI